MNQALRVRGWFAEPFEPWELAQSLEAAGACAHSVLTEGEFFRGSWKNVRDARKSIQLPVLRKDFIFDSWQVWQTRANGTDSFLLIFAAREGALLPDLIVVGPALGTYAPAEIHTARGRDSDLAA